jgi:hypothetical protein
MRLRSSQFSEDAGPMAHPIRPDSYIKMDNFYTVTVYEKVRGWVDGVDGRLVGWLGATLLFSPAHLPEYQLP